MQIFHVHESYNMTIFRQSNAIIHCDSFQVSTLCCFTYHHIMVYADQNVSIHQTTSIKHAVGEGL